MAKYKRTSEKAVEIALGRRSRGILKKVCVACEGAGKELDMQDKADIESLGLGK